MRILRAGGRFTVYPRALLGIAVQRLCGREPDAIIDTCNGVPFFARLVSRAPVVVLVHHVHRELWPVAGPVLRHLGWWLESCIAPALHRDCQYLTVSLPSAEDLAGLGVDPARIAVVRNGVDPVPAEVYPQPAGPPRLVVLSRLVPYKRIEDALAVTARLRRMLPGLVLDVVGSGWWEPTLRRKALELGLTDDAVRFHGHVDEERKHQLLARAWLHLLPSRKEGWGLAVIEAAQHGVPTVGYRSCGGLTDSVVDGVTGLLAADPTDLAAKTLDLLVDGPRRRAMGAKARSRAAEFSWRHCATGVASVLTAAASSRPVSGLH
jgi:glycosyltransferase involved in cell wall biosynthesis